MVKSHFLISLILLHFSLLRASPNPDTKALMAFKSASDTFNKLTTWNASTDPCSWYGVSCLQNRVSRLVLEGLDLRGSIQPLTALTQLRILSLKRNRLSGPIPDLTNLTALKLLFLSYNEFSGEFPPSAAALFRLYRLDLSYNNFSGQIPVAVNRLTHLLTLRLEENQFSGTISQLNLPSLQDFNVSGNRLAGEIPKSFSGFPKSAFILNQVLCGPPLAGCKSVSSDPTRPGSSGAMVSPLTPLVSSSPSSIPDKTPPIKSANPHHAGASKISSIAIIAIIIGDVLVLAVVSIPLYCYFGRTRAGKSGDGRKGSRILEDEKIVYSSSPYPAAQPGFATGRMVFFEGARRFELEDLLRASAEMLGKGGFGTAYKAVLDDGNVVAVKRLKDASVVGRRELEQHMEILGRLRHQNVVALKAYYFARDEKLLVYDYMPNGNLFWLLHGNRGPGRTPLDWTTRLKIANRSSPRTCLHPQLIYRAPEALDPRKITQKADVYSFGVLLLELLTGKCPSLGENVGPGTGYGGVVDLPRWVQSVVREEWTAEVFDLELMRYKDIEEEMVGLLQIAMACTAAATDQRPKMSQVVKMIEEISGVEVSPSHEASDCVLESPSVSEEACGVNSQ
ncbi:leucine-rich repeat transmembrane protein kinase family protein [Actinidia rufa]|uniref:Leucine-rich repeat transmembrane protein kinase family protein n=1 Tax=Actinidia rufa TaxID=165716 RepID=A0A7J0GZ11_9ERIC|nr:leucine-rich repeat transmembrane protein kinase family protein [Actinidia rufa]